ncbi:hypothetical protein [Runella zeae]|uniref:hypothetical protein n=1 Tax=Runella zeae TaxID=94255 RepID=UPI0012F7FF69|nr:hypothetical protein [Runella zeae]
MKTIMVSFVLLMGLLGCKNKDITAQLGRVWIVKQAIHIDKNGGRNVVYDKTNGINLFNYEPFLLDLTNADALKFTDVAVGGDRYDFVGKWRVDEKVRLVLYDLSPEPTCIDDRSDCMKDGIQFFINSSSDNELKINRLYSSDKTGDTLNEYTLQPK